MKLLKALMIEMQNDDAIPKMGPDRKAVSAKAASVAEGVTLLANITDFNSDHAYHGKTVGPNDKDKVLLCWKLDDGRYQVIFGDLRAETVTAEQLRALEGK